MFAFVFRVQPVLFQKLAENLLQDDLQVANWLLHFCLRPCFHPAFSQSNKQHTQRQPAGGRQGAVVSWSTICFKSVQYWKKIERWCYGEVKGWVSMNYNEVCSL